MKTWTVQHHQNTARLVTGSAVLIELPKAHAAVLITVAREHNEEMCNQLEKNLMAKVEAASAIDDLL